MQTLKPECHVYIKGLTVDGFLTGKFIASMTMVAKFRTVVQYIIHLKLWKCFSVGELRLKQHVSSNCNFTEST